MNPERVRDIVGAVLKISCGLGCFILVAPLSCSREQSGFASPADSLYTISVEQWHNSRLASLTSDRGWLTLAGLFWLEPGENRFGSDPSNDMVFPRGMAPFIGRFYLQHNRVRVSIDAGVEVTHNGVPVSEMELNSDEEGVPSVMTLGSFSWHVIRRGRDPERIGIRLRDRASPRLLHFEGIERFPVDRAWRLQARLERHDPPKTLSIVSATGTVDQEISPGALVFSFQGVEYRLDPIGQPGDSVFFLIFADRTSGVETYGGGRFLYVDAPDNDSGTFIDFNRAYNPPCAFTPYATCPLPPPQNRLPFRVTAGEKQHHGTGH